MQLKAQKTNGSAIIIMATTEGPRSSDVHNASRLTRDLDASTSTPPHFHPGFQKGLGPGKIFPKLVLAFIQYAYKKTVSYGCVSLLYWLQLRV